MNKSEFDLRLKVHDVIVERMRTVLLGFVPLMEARGHREFAETMRQELIRPAPVLIGDRFIDGWRDTFRVWQHAYDYCHSYPELVPLMPLLSLDRILGRAAHNKTPNERIEFYALPLVETL